MPQGRKSFFYENGLSIVMLVLMLTFLCGQYYTGWHVKNEQLIDNGQRGLSATEYFQSGHFIQATFENWESEFLQMALYVLLTVWLKQKGSSESKKLYETEAVDREPKVHPQAPWPVKRGGMWLALYRNSLTIVLATMFMASFILHFYGSLLEYNDENEAQGLPSVSWQEYVSGSRFWFESFQNWQSEFLAVAAIVLLSIWFRQQGSPESKPVDAAYSETGK